MKIFNYSISERIDVGTWKAGVDTNIITKNAAQMDNITSYATYRVAIVEQKPFIFRDENHPSGYNGYNIDLLDELARRMRFRYNITSADELGKLDGNGKWDGLMGQLMDGEVDMAFSLYVTAARLEILDFTVPITDQEGINILVKTVPVPDDLFKFVHVFENEVWFCIILAYFVTSLLMWIFTNFKPSYYPLLDEKITNRKKKNKKIRNFTLSECLWFCLTSFTALGGEQAPYKFSSRLVAATWYIFAFIMICTYTANLAAVSTRSREQSYIISLTDLTKQYKMQFATIDGSFEMAYFRNRAHIERELYKVWENLSLNDSLIDIERSKLAVFEYPFPNEYNNIWKMMQDSGFPKSLKEGVARVKNSTSSTEGFALVGNSALMKYIAGINCDLMVVGEEFAMKPVAIALPRRSPLTKALDEHILEIEKERITDVLKEKWWANNPEKMKCPEEVDATDGMSIRTMSGIFVLLFSGIFIACLILGVDYCILKMNLVAPQKNTRKTLKDSKYKMVAK